MLGDIDLDSLADRMDEIYIEAEEYQKREMGNQTWYDAIFGDEKHFEFFLTRVEEGILKACGLNDDTRRRILKELGTLRLAS